MTAVNANWAGQWFPLTNAQSLTSNFPSSVPVILMALNTSPSTNATITYAVGGNAPVDILVPAGNNVAFPTIIAAGSSNITVSCELTSSNVVWVALVYPGSPMPNFPITPGNPTQLPSLTYGTRYTGATYEKINLAQTQGTSAGFFAVWVGNATPAVYAVNWAGPGMPAGYPEGNVTGQSLMSLKSTNYMGQQLTVFNISIPNTPPVTVTDVLQ